MRKLLLIALFFVSALAFASGDQNIFVVKGDCVECRVDLTKLIQNPELEYHFLNADQLHRYLLEHSPLYKKSFANSLEVVLKPAGEVDLEIEIDYTPLQEGGDGVGGSGGGV